MTLQKRALYFLASLFITLGCVAQNFVPLTGVVTDSDSQAWKYATWTANIVVPGQGLAHFADGTPVPIQIHDLLAADGSFLSTASLPDNSRIVPAGTQWQLTVCPLTSAPCQKVSPVSVKGSPFQMGTYLSSQIAAPRIQGSNLVYAYNATEVINMTNGNGYTNTLDKKTYLWNPATGWIATNGGGVTPAGNIFRQLQVRNADGTALDYSASTFDAPGNGLARSMNGVLDAAFNSTGDNGISLSLSSPDLTAHANSNYASTELDVNSHSRGELYHPIAPNLADNTHLQDHRSSGNNVFGDFVNNPKNTIPAISQEFHYNKEPATVGGGSLNYGVYFGSYDYCCGKNGTGGWRVNKTFHSVLDSHASGITAMDHKTGYFFRDGDFQITEQSIVLGIWKRISDDEGGAGLRGDVSDVPMMHGVVDSVTSPTVFHIGTMQNYNNYGEGLYTYATRGATSGGVAFSGAPDPAGTYNQSPGTFYFTAPIATVSTSHMAFNNANISIDLQPGNQTILIPDVAFEHIANGYLTIGTACLSSPDNPNERVIINSVEPYNLHGDSLQHVSLYAHYSRHTALHIFQGPGSCGMIRLDADSDAQGREVNIPVAGSDATNMVYYSWINAERWTVPDASFFTPGNATYNGVTLFPNAVQALQVVNPASHSFDGTIVTSAGDAGIIQVGDTMAFTHGAQQFIYNHINMRVASLGPNSGLDYTNFDLVPEYWAHTSAASVEPMANYAPNGGPKPVTAVWNRLINVPYNQMFTSNLPPSGPGSAFHSVSDCWHPGCTSPSDTYGEQSFRTRVGYITEGIDAYNGNLNLQSTNTASGDTAVTTVSPQGIWNNVLLGGNAIGINGLTPADAHSFIRYIGNGGIFGFMSGRIDGSPLSFGSLDHYMPSFNEDSQQGGGTVFGDSGIGAFSSRLTAHADGVFSLDTYTSDAPPNRFLQRGKASLEIGALKIAADAVTTTATSPANGATCNVKGFILGEDLHVSYCNGATVARII